MSSIGSNFQSSLEITSQLKELGAKYVVSKASRDIHAKFLLRNGADEVTYPDRDIARKVAKRFTANNVFDYIELTEKYSTYRGASARKMDRQSNNGFGDSPTTYNTSILGIKNGEDINIASSGKLCYKRKRPSYDYLAVMKMLTELLNFCDFFKIILPYNIFCAKML